MSMPSFTLGLGPEIGMSEIILIAVVILVLFGGRKIPEFMRGLGKGIREFNDAKNNVRKEIEEGINDTKDKLSMKEPQKELESK